MNKFWKLIFYTGEGEFETKELIINDTQYRQVQKALGEGREFIVLENKPTIKGKLIASITDATDEVGEYQKQNLELPGLSGPNQPPKLTGRISAPQSIKDYLKETRSKFYKKMGWESTL